MGVARPPQTIGEYDVLQLTNGAFKANCYVVSHAGSGGCLVVDPGSEAGFLCEQLELRGLTPQKLLLTHGHFDHLGAVDALMQRYSVACEVHGSEERLVRQAATYAFRFSREPLRVPRNLTYFGDDARLDWNGRAIDVIPAPGHTAGSVALSLGGAFVFTGDTLFHERIGPTNYPESDPGAIRASVSAIVEDLPETCVIFPGHGRPWSVGAARVWWRGLTGVPPSCEIF